MELICNVVSDDPGVFKETVGGSMTGYRGPNLKPFIHKQLILHIPNQITINYWTSIEMENGSWSPVSPSSKPRLLVFAGRSFNWKCVTDCWAFKVVASTVFVFVDAFLGCAQDFCQTDGAGFTSWKSSCTKSVVVDIAAYFLSFVLYTMKIDIKASISFCCRCIQSCFHGGGSIVLWRADVHQFENEAKCLKMCNFIYENEKNFFYLRKRFALPRRWLWLLIRGCNSA